MEMRKEGCSEKTHRGTETKGRVAITESRPSGASRSLGDRVKGCRWEPSAPRRGILDLAAMACLQRAEQEYTCLLCHHSPCA